MPTNKTLGKPATEVLLILAEDKRHLTYTDIVDIGFERQFNKKADQSDKQTGGEWWKMRNRFIQAIRRIKQIQTETGCFYIENPTDAGKMFKIHDDTCFQKITAIILLEFFRARAARDEVIKGDFEKSVYEKYKGIETSSGHWSENLIVGKMRSACENSYTALEDNKYEPLPRLKRDLELITELVKNSRDKQTDVEIANKLTELLGE